MIIEAAFVSLVMAGGSFRLYVYLHLGGGGVAHTALAVFVAEKSSLVFSQSLYLLSVKDDGPESPDQAHFLVIFGPQHRSPNNKNK